MSETALPKSVIRQLNLAILRCERFKKTRQISELFKAIQSLAAVIEMEDGSFRDLASFPQLSTLSALSESIALIEKEMINPEIDPETRILRQERLAELLMKRDRQTGQMSIVGHWFLSTSIMRSDDLNATIEHLSEALKWYEKEWSPRNCLRIGRELGNLLYGQNRFADAVNAYTVAAKALEEIRTTAQSNQERQRQAELNAELYARLVHCALRERKQIAAFEYAVAGKGRAFVDMLSTTRFDLIKAGADEPELAADLQKSRELRQQIDTLLTRLTEHSRQIDEEQKKQERALVRELQRQELKRWQEVAYKYPALTATQSAPSLSVEQAQALAVELEATLVEFVQHAGGWSAFVVTAETIHHVSLSGVNDEFLREKGLDWVNQVEETSFHNEASYWYLDEWYEVLITPLKPHLPPEGKLLLAPAGALHLMPLSIARDPDTERYLCDEYALSFAPSLAALRVTYSAKKKAHVGKESLTTLLAVAYQGELGQPNYLIHARREAKAIEKHFSSVTRLYRKNATPQAVVEKAKGQAVAHFSCHGTFDSDLPEQSGLVLSGGYLTVQRIITELRLSDARLTTLSACLTHRADLRGGEEHVGLVQALMTAGSRAVVASLWSVPEDSTHVLFEQFYAAVAKGHAPAEALAQAMRHVRQKPKWEHPYFWAAFQVSGLGYESANTNQLTNQPTY